MNASYTGPASAPLYSEPPFLFRHSTLLGCTFQANPAAVRSLVPEPLNPLPGDLAYGWQSEMHSAEIGSYHEAVISIPVELHGKPGSYVAYIYVDTDTALAAGREIWGYPKKLGHFLFSDRSGVLTRGVERDGVELFKVSMQSIGPGKPEDLAAAALPTYNLKIIPAVQAAVKADVRQLTATSMQNVVVHRFEEGTATVVFGNSAADPLNLLEPIQVLKAIYVEADFDLTHGEVAYDYQAVKSASRSGVA